MGKIVKVLLLVCAVLCSCTKFDEPVLEEGSAAPPDGITRSSAPPSFDTLPNPYALHVMQAVCDSLVGGKTLRPTDLYVRFLPRDGEQMDALKYGCGLELFDYPLDLDIGEGEVYVDPSIPEGRYSWVYATVEPDFVFPEGITYEILERCYIPGEAEAVLTAPDGRAVDIERAAFERMGYALDAPSVGPSGGWVRPTGTIRVYDDEAAEYVPVKGVKIRCHNVVKWSTSYTDENGCYRMDSKFVTRIHYAIVFDNRSGFDIWGNWGPLARANLSMGWHSNKGHSRDIGHSTFGWAWSVVNNAGYDYYRMCEQTSIPKPPDDIKIWVFKDFGISSAPMVRRVSVPIRYNSDEWWTNFLINSALGHTVDRLLADLKFLLPDIIMGTDSREYRRIYETLNHELAHASHFRQVRQEFWAKYIEYIITYGSYGDGTGRNAELCGIGEMWGFSMGYIQGYENYGESGVDVYFEGKPNGGWIKPDVFWDLFWDRVLTKKQIYDCLTPEVDTYDELFMNMCITYFSRAAEIEKAFLEHGIIPSFPRPSAPYDTYYTDQTVSSDCAFSGNDILARNITVTAGAVLTLRGENSVTLNAPFTVEAGAGFEMLLGAE